MMTFLQLFFSTALLWAAPESQIKTKAPATKPTTKWNQDLSLGVGLDFRRQPELNPSETDFATRFSLHTDRIWQERWMGGVQYSYSSNEKSIGALNAQTQNHEVLLRAFARVHLFSEGAIWFGLNGGFERKRVTLEIKDSDKQVRWGDWQWVLAPELALRHGLYKNIWLQESVSYYEGPYLNQGEWNFALRLGVDLSNY